MARRGRRCHPRKGGWWHVSRRTEPCCWLEKSQLGLEIPLVALRCQDRSQGLINVTQRRKAWDSLACRRVEFCLFRCDQGNRSNLWLTIQFRVF